ncbi:hypothetical protein GCM10027072_60530 [Streptomyces bullii]
MNLLGTLRMTRACLPALKERGGSVVFVGTQSAVTAPSQVRQAAYAASKGALTSAMYSLARELGPYRGPAGAGVRAVHGAGGGDIGGGGAGAADGPDGAAGAGDGR